MIVRDLIVTFVCNLPNEWLRQILGIVLDLGGGPDHDRLGFRFWHHPGPFVQYLGIAGAKGRFLGWWKVMTQAAFSFIGTEIVAIAAGEAKNPRRNIPKAIKRVYIRILLFYITGTFIIGLLVPSNEPDLAHNGTALGSPFVIAIRRAGIKGLPSVINAALLTSAWSAASSDLYTSSRALYGLALAGNAPRFFAFTTKRGLPLAAIGCGIAFSFLSFMGVTTGSNRVFQWFVNMTSIAGLMTWFGINVTYIRFYKGFVGQGFERSKLPFASKLNPYAAWYGAIACPFICFVSLPYPHISETRLFAHCFFAVLGLRRVHPRELVDGELRDELPAVHPLPDPVHRLAVLVPVHARGTGGHGLPLGPEGGRGGVVRRAAAEEYGGEVLGVAGMCLFSFSRG